MKKELKLLIPSVIIIALMFICCIYNNHILNNYKKDLTQLKNTNNKLTENIERTKSIVGFYSKDIVELRKQLNGPIYSCKETDKKLLINVNDYIIKNKLYGDELIFQIGPIREDSKNICFVECLTFENLNVEKTFEKTFENVYEIFPMELLQHHLIKCTMTKGTVKYERIE